MKKLTKRELEILKLLSQGLENKEIARILFLSQHTVKTHISSIINKLNARNRVNTVYIAMAKKLI